MVTTEAFELSDAPAQVTELEALFARLARGEIEALGPIYDLTSGDLYGLALWRCGSGSEAEDAMHDAFVRLVTTGADLGRVRDPRAYLLSMVRRAACDVIRRRPPGEPAEELLLEAPVTDPALGADAERASRALHRLPGTQREAVYLRHYLGLTFAEIGRVARVPTFTAASRCRLGLAKLRKLLGVAA